MEKIADGLNILKMTPIERAAYQEYMNKTLNERDYIVSTEQKNAYC